MIITLLVFILLTSEALSAASPPVLSKMYKRIETDGEKIECQPSWFAGNPPVESIPHAHFIEAYEPLSDHSLTLDEWGDAARITLDEALPRCGVVLLRNLKFIHTAADFAKFWRGCCADKTTWEPAIYRAWGPNRQQEDGVDLATNIPASIVLPCHNENAYFPQPVGRICLFCSKSAIEGKHSSTTRTLSSCFNRNGSQSSGGESLVARNQDITDLISDDVKDFIKAHGGLRYVCKFHSAANDEEKVKAASPTSAFGQSWQSKCGTESKDEVKRMFIEIGFKAPDIEFDEDDNVTLTYISSGFRTDAYTGNESWFSVGIEMGLADTADGTPFTQEMKDNVRMANWKVR